MVMEFMTKRNANGHRKYLCFDTEKMIYATDKSCMIPDFVEVKTSDIDFLRVTVERAGYKRVDFI